MLEILLHSALGTIGFFMVCWGMLVDVVVRLRMKRTGEKWVFLRGGFYDYRPYVRICRQYGWSPLLAYLIPVLYIPGAIMMVVTILSNLAASPHPH